MHITVPYLCWPYYVLHPSCFFYNPLLYPSSPHFTFYYICTVHVMNYTYMYVNVLTTCSIVHTVQNCETHPNGQKFGKCAWPGIFTYVELVKSSEDWGTALLKLTMKKWWLISLRYLEWSPGIQWQYYLNKSSNSNEIWS